MAEQLIGALADDDFSPTYLRNATAYGSSPRLRADIVVNNLTGAALTDGRGPAAERRLAVATAGPRRGHLAGLPRRAGGRPGGRARPGVQRRTRRGRRPDPRPSPRRSRSAPVHPSPSPRAPRADKRDYRVDFGKIGRLLPAFQPSLDGRGGIDQLADDMGRHGLTRAAVRGDLRAARAGAAPGARRVARRPAAQSGPRADRPESVAVTASGPLPRVSVVVVTYNSADVVERCLTSLRDGGADGVELTEVVVVDNASQDDTLARAEAVGGVPVRVVRLGANLGYAAGINAGVDSLAEPHPDAVMVLNPDCRLRRGALATLAHSLERTDVGHRGAEAGQPRRLAPAHAAAVSHGHRRPRRVAPRRTHRRPARRGRDGLPRGAARAPGPGELGDGCGAAPLLGPRRRRRAPGTSGSSSTARRPSTCCGRPTTAGRRGTTRTP